MTESPTYPQLLADIERTGFFPELVYSAAIEALSGLEPEAHYVHLETHLGHSELHRHVTVMMLVGKVLLLVHLDDQHLEQDRHPTVAHVVLGTVPLRLLKISSVDYAYDSPQTFSASVEPSAMTLRLAWTGGGMMDFMPAQCDDPKCRAIHGYTGDMHVEDLNIRVSATADGAPALASARAFARALRAKRLQLEL
ncbi:MAG: DUF5998 family protein [Rothia sp. (in: high G+C Gram-positive bacteria)]|uniref:DUF5998 family protein n=1 Tax=Rothia sp. (in: high G+C Gram-positive bacteria) TaxID=1885016 RepID=UPI0026E0BD37|nr:DUF5998 family protein [Rothia sp. (in: high G+C Gram-positive bacteria)]MDO5750812.1 DUF5998 family protein [Rothia sp. (in: high G+C Gram-positive bacteria)]